MVLPKLMVVFLFVSSSGVAAVMDGAKDYDRKTHFKSLLNEMEMTTCRRAVERNVFNDESVSMSGRHALCLLKSMPAISSMSLDGTLFLNVMNDKNESEMALALKPTLVPPSKEEKNKTVKWTCLVKPKEVLPFAPDCKLLDDKNLVSEDGAKPATLDNAIAWGDRVMVGEFIRAGSDVNKSTRLDGDTPLLTAFRSRNPDIVETLLQKGADINGVGSEGQTLLMLAVSRGDINLVKQALDRGADINAMDKISGDSVLHYLARSPSTASVEILNLLLAQHADVKAANNQGVTPLHLAAVHADIPLIDQMIAAGADINSRDSLHKTPLLFLLASKSSQEEKALHLIEKGAQWVHGAFPLSEIYYIVAHGNKTLFNMALPFMTDFNIKSDDGYSLLHLAANGGFTDLAALIIERGGLVNAVDKEGVTPLHMAAGGGYTETVALLVSKGAHIHEIADRKTPLYLAIQNGFFETAKVLAEIRKKPSSPGEDSPLKPAIEQNNLEMVKLLLDNGYNVNSDLASGSLETKGLTPIMAAALIPQNMDLVQYLLARGADPRGSVLLSFHEENSKFRIEFSFSLMGLVVVPVGQWPKYIMPHLLESGAPFHSGVAGKFYYKNTLVAVTETAPLHFVSAHGDSSSVEMLLKHGADINVRAASQITKSKKIEKKVIEIIRKEMTEQNDKIRMFFDEQNGWTPLHFAVTANNFETARTLVKQGADINARDYQGKKAIDYVKPDNAVMIKILKKS